MTTTVHLLRHGEVYNPDGVLYGRLPGFRLSVLGVEQAEAAAQWLAERDIGYLASSPLTRARETAAPLSAATGVQIVIDDRLIEADNVLEGRAVADGRGLFRDPSIWKHFRNPVRPSWGEPYTEVAERVLAAARTARDEAGGRDAVCVTHQLPVVCARRSVEGRRLFHDPRNRECNLGSVTSLTFDGDVVVAVDYHEPAADLAPGAGAGA